MTQYLSRRERRVAEKSGIPEELTTPQISEQSAIPVVELEPISMSIPVDPAPLPEPEQSWPMTVAVEQSLQTPAPIEVAESAAPILSRRALRDAERSGKPIAMPVEVKPEVTIAVTPQAPAPEESVDPASLDVSDIYDSKEETITFTGTNLLAEPSTQSIVLEVVPEAVSLPIDVTGEIVSTGSIAVIPDTTAAIVTATMDGSQLDQVAMKDAVTGVISVVEPVSALSVISERENVGVVPEATLRKGWWIKWLIGIGALVMTVAAVWATLTILELIGN